MAERIDNEGVACTPQPLCPRCAQPGTIAHAGLRDPLFGAPGLWDFRRCTGAGCGLGWIDPQPRADEVHKLYDDYHTHVQRDENDFLATLPSPRKRAIKRLLATLIFWRRPLFRSDLAFLEGAAPGRLLDIGCGSGELLAAAKALGWTPVGVDFDAAAVAAANGHAGVVAYARDVFEEPFERASFDAVVLSHVIEHVSDPAAYFAEARRLLRDGGRLVMITPNVDAEGFRLFGRDWRGLETPRHFHLFDPSLLRRYASQAGFSRVAAFSYSAGAAGPMGMHAASAALARAAGRPSPVADFRKLERRQKLLDLVGVERGELAVIVAHA